MDLDGTEVVCYNYDAWGNYSLTGNTQLGELNPFRYRGYHYDTETDLYFLQTRYYDPEIGRFISQDDVSYLDPEHINGLNLYAYCGNNPVMNVDPTGEFFFSLLITIVAGAVLAAASSIVSQLATTGTVNWAQVGISALFGAVSGALAFTGFGGILGQFLIQGTLSVLETVSLAAVDGTLSELSAGQLIGTFLISGAMGCIGAKGAAKEFKRVSQMEKSLFQCLKRGFRKNGLPGVIQMWGIKSGKYVRQFIKPLIKSGAISTSLSTTANISLFWGQKLYELLN